MDKINLVENLNAIKRVREQIKSGNASHSYIFSSLDKITLDNVADLCAYYLLAEGQPNINLLNRIKNKTHSDIFYFGIEKTYNVAQCENIITEAQVKPLEGNKKIFIFYYSEHMSEIIQNKLLKLVEEPPKNVHLIFTTQNYKKMLQTIISRNQLIFVEPFSDNELKNYLLSSGENEDKANAIIDCVGGNLTMAEHFMKDNKFLIEYRFLLDRINDLCNNKDDGKLLKYLIDNKNRIKDILVLTQNIANSRLRDQIYLKSDKYIDLFKSIITQTNLAVEKLEKNFNYNAIIDIMLMNIKRKI